MKLIDVYEDSVDGSLTDEENIGRLHKMVVETGLRLSQYERMIDEREANRLAAEFKAAQTFVNESGKASRQISSEASKLKLSEASNLVEIMNNASTNMTRLATPDAAVAAAEIERVIGAITGVGATDRKAAGWEAWLGTGVKGPTGRLFGAHLPAVYDAMAAEFGDFDPSVAEHKGVTQSRHTDLAGRVEIQRAHLRRVDVELQDKRQVSADLLAAIEAGEKPELIDGLGKRLHYLNNSVLTKSLASVKDPIEYARKLKEVRDDDPAYQKLVERSDKSWAALDSAETGSGDTRAAFARLLSNDDFQAWASSNGFTVGTSKVDERGRTIEFNPGKDLMVAFRVAQKQKRKRPVASDEGAFISRPGERDLVRLVTKDGEVVLGRKLPMQAADVAGSHRMSTAGGERYFDPTKVGSFSVVKAKKHFDLGGEVVKARGDRDAKLAAMALEAAQKRGEQMPGGELPEAPTPVVFDDDPDWLKKYEELSERGGRITPPGSEEYIDAYGQQATGAPPDKPSDKPAQSPERRVFWGGDRGAQPLDPDYGELVGDPDWVAASLKGKQKPPASSQASDVPATSDLPPEKKREARAKSMNQMKPGPRTFQLPEVTAGNLTAAQLASLPQPGGYDYGVWGDPSKPNQPSPFVTKRLMEGPSLAPVPARALKKKRKRSLGAGS